MSLVTVDGGGLQLPCFVVIYAAAALSRSSAAHSQSSAEPGVGSGLPPGGVSTTAVNSQYRSRRGSAASRTASRRRNSRLSRLPYALA